MSLVLNLTAKSQKVLRKLAELGEPERNELLQFLEDNLEQLGSSANTMDVAAKAVKLDREVAFLLLDFLSGLCVQRLSTQKKYQDLVDAVIDSLKRADGNPEFSPAELKKIRASLSGILSSPTLALKSKAIRLQTTHDKVFANAELFSDVRPVFAVDGKAEIEAAISFHTLRIDYYHDGASHTFSCALDAADLKKLGEALERTSKKQAAIAGLLKRSKLSHLIVG